MGITAPILDQPLWEQSGAPRDGQTAESPTITNSRNTGKYKMLKTLRELIFSIGRDYSRKSTYH